MLKTAPFFDTGVVWNVNDNSNQLQKQNFLAAVGLGVEWQPIPKMNVRLDYALSLVNLDDRGKNAQDDGFYFSVSTSNLIVFELTMIPKQRNPVTCAKPGFSSRKDSGGGGIDKGDA